VAFSPDGQLLAGAASDGTIALEEVWLFAHPYKALCADVGPPTAQSWGSYAPGERQPKVCACTGLPDVVPGRRRQLPGGRARSDPYHARGCRSPWPAAGQRGLKPHNSPDGEASRERNLRAHP
jgi:hypothetical protein